MAKFTELKFNYNSNLEFYSTELLDKMGAFTEDLTQLLDSKYKSENKYSSESKLKQYFSDNLDFAKNILVKAYNEYNNVLKSAKSLKELETSRDKLKIAQKSFCNQMNIFIGNTLGAKGTDGLDSASQILLWEGKPKNSSEYYNSAKGWQTSITQILENIDEQEFTKYDFPYSELKINRQQWKNVCVWDSAFTTMFENSIVKPLHASIVNYLSTNRDDYAITNILTDTLWKPLNDFLLECKNVKKLPFIATTGYKNATVSSFQKLKEIILKNDSNITNNECETFDLSFIEFIWLLLIRVYKRSVIEFNKECKSNVEYSEMRPLLDKYKSNTTSYRGKDPGDN